MAGMDLLPRRADRGVSVFWMILAMGAGVFALLAILLVSTENAVEPLPQDDGAEITVNEGETSVTGTGNTEVSADDNDPTFTGGTVTVDGPTEEGDVPAENVEADVSVGEPSEDAAAPQAEEGEAAVPGQGEVVVDPDGTTAPHGAHAVRPRGAG